MEITLNEKKGCRNGWSHNRNNNVMCWTVDDNEIIPARLFVNAEGVCCEKINEH